MKNAFALFVEGFMEGWNGASAKPAGNPQPPKATAAGFHVGTHLTAEELDTVFSLLAEPPYATQLDKPTEQAPQTTDAPCVTDRTGCGGTGRCSSASCRRADCSDVRDSGFHRLRQSVFDPGLLLPGSGRSCD
jgi:hypothetical protein